MNAELSFEQSDTELHKYNYLQFKIMQAMGFDEKRPGTEWHDQGYSDRYREMFNRERSENQKFIDVIPTEFTDPEWESEVVIGIIAKFVAELEKPLVQ